MTTYILTWNPSKWSWDDLPIQIDRVRRGLPVEETWSSGNTKKIPVGSRVFLLRQGSEPRGIMASGWTTAPPDELPHWDEERRARRDLANFVPFTYETILDPERDALLDPREFPPGPAGDVYWAMPASGLSIPETAAIQLEALWSEHTGADSAVGAGDVELSAIEGATRLRLVRHRSRERALRRAKLEDAERSGGLRCEVPGCGFDFAAVYGPLGDGYAQVHHLRPLASLDRPTPVRLQDLAVVCANCHVMIHRDGGCRGMENLIPAGGRR